MTSRAFATFAALTMLASLLAVPLATASPAIGTSNAITPSQGPTNGGTAIKIAGSGFKPGAVVQFVDASGSYTATNIQVSGAKGADGAYPELLATTPAHPATGKVNVVVTNPGGEGSATSADGFTYTANPAPTLSSVFPSAGTSNGNDVVVLTGTGFSTGVPPLVLFGTGITCATVVTVQATVLQPLSSTKLAVLVPPRGGLPSCSSSFGITVQNPDGSTPASLGPSNGYTYIAQPTPNLSSVSPVSGPDNGGTTLTLSGSNFAPGAQVLFRAHDTPGIKAPAASTVFISSTQLNVVSPAVADATGGTLPVAGGGIDIVVTNPDGSVADDQQRDFSYTNAGNPVVTSLSPATGPAIGGSVVTVTGSGFAAGAGLGVLFNGVPATDVTFVSNSQITAVSPACTLAGCASGRVQVDVRVQNPDDKLSAARPFNYTALVRIDSIQAGDSGVASSNLIVRTDGKPSAFTTEKAVLKGAGFPNPCRVLVGGIEAAVTSCAPDTVKFDAPATTLGTRDVTVLGGPGTDGRGAVMKGAISYVLSPAPTITSLSVTTAGSNGATPTGPATTVITGTNFIPVQNAAGDFVWPTVRFEGTGVGVNAKVVAATPTSLTVEVPAVQGSLVPTTPAGLPVDVKVTNHDAQGATLLRTSTSPTPFHYTRDAPPALGAGQTCTPSGVPPPACTQGPTTGGTQFTLTGSGFVVGTKVLFGTSATPAMTVTAVACPATPTETCVNSAGTGLQVFSPPAGSGAAATVGLKLRNPDVQEYTPPTGSPMSFVYQATPAPLVVAVTPSTIDAVGGRVTIGNTRTPFVYGPDLAVTIDTTVIPACSASATPALYCIKPTDITNGGNSLSVAAPGRAAGGSVSVKVTNNDKQSDTLASALSYRPSAPISTVTSPVSPSNGAAGTIVTVSGTGFSVDPAVGARLPSVRVGAVSCSGTTLPTGCAEAVVCTAANTPVAGCLAPVNGNPDRLSFVMPAVAKPGPQTLLVTNPDGNSVSIGGGFRSLALPTGVTLAPTHDTVNGGAVVTFTKGTAATDIGFDTGSSTPPPLVVFGDPPASPLRLGASKTVTDTQLTAIVPRGDLGDATAYLVDADGQALTLRHAFTYDAALPPSFTSVNPPLASVNGGAQVVVTGSGFAPGARVCLRPAGETTLAGGVATPACRSDGTAPERSGLLTTPVLVSTMGDTGTNTLTFVAPSHSAGPVDVVISNPSGAAADTLLLPAKESRFGYTQVPGPVLSTVTPNSGDVAGGTAITLAGVNFASDARVTINGTAATDVVVVSSTSITAKTPPGKAGPATVTVTVAGLSASIANGFTYTGTDTTTSTTTTGTNTNTQTTTQTTTTRPTTTTSAAPNPTTEQLINANKAIRVTVTRDGKDNVITFVLPSSTPAPPAGVQIFRSNSPYVLIANLTAGSPGYTARSYRDAGAPLDSTYVVTMFYANNLGRTSRDPSAVPGFDQLDGVQSDAVKQEFYTKLAYGIGIAVLAILVIVLVVVLVRRRGRAQPAPYQGGDVGYVAPAAEAPPETQPATPAGPTHTVNCPVCKTTFEAVGEKPLRMRCPNCGREGILR